MKASTQILTTTLLVFGVVLTPLKPDSAVRATPSVEGNWTVTGSLNTARYGHTATLLPNGQVLVVGGIGPDRCNAITSTAEHAVARAPITRAVRLTRQALRRQSQDRQLTEAIFFYEQGLAFQRAGRFKEAAAAFERAISSKPDFAEAYNNLGYIYYSLGRGGKALRALRQAISLKPDIAPAHSNLGNVLVSLGENQQALISFKEAVRLGLNDEVTQCSLGVAYYRLKQYEIAAQGTRVIRLLSLP